ncbi:hypothetical protein M427DRAFT_137704 [Gonapodya prolifera JEL478]|uniref:DNA polymerase delta subunit 3 n=1 Tax=Gonapodya prolifera (strain JEL478) TaxID=1344416 RepID=A0A139A567_GONPJ|nr:hypothetical protein M427DRAFT_137704 [Gonapodya prolifera JEL478]|eukprot:KXS11884.1 hypothetical protein M427DRAFT_137704 [Gonapodya prolifera JEL478]
MADYTETLTRLINDENRIVSYHLLSKLLDVDFNTSKQMLASFESQPPIKREDFHVTFCTSGVLKNGQGIGVFLVSEDGLDDAKEKFSVFSSHVYCIAPVKPKDLEVLCAGDITPDLVRQAGKFSGITNDNITFEEKRRPAVAAPPAAPTSLQPSRSEPAQTGDPKSNGIKSMFAKAESAAPKPPLTKLEPKKTTAAKGKASQQAKAQGKGGAAAKKQSAPVADVDEDFQVGRKTKGFGKRKIEDSVSDESDESGADLQRREPVIEEDETEMEGVEIDDNAEANAPNILDTAADAPEAPTDNSLENMLFNAAPGNAPKGRRRYKKIVPRTYRDEKGYIVTTQEEVIVSESEDESPPPSRTVPTASIRPATAPKAVPKKSAPPTTEPDSPPPKKGAGRGKSSGGGTSTAKKDEKGNNSGQKSLLSFFAKK